MEKFFASHRKEIITGAGALIFILSGAFAMFITQSGNHEPVRESQSQSQNQIAIIEPQPQPQPQIQETLKEIYVYVTGAVNKPGVYKFNEGSRIFEAMDAAGGFTQKADIAELNLADNLEDKMHIHVPARGDRKRMANSNNNTDTYTHITVKPSETKPIVNQKNKNLVDINNSSEIELQRLTGVGPAIAKRILEYRQKHGRFNSADDLVKVRGIGPAKLEKMRSQIIIR